MIFEQPNFINRLLDISYHIRTGHTAAVVIKKGEGKAWYFDVDYGTFIRPLTTSEVVQQFDDIFILCENWNVFNDVVREVKNETLGTLSTHREIGYINSIERLLTVKRNFKNVVFLQISGVEKREDWNQMLPIIFDMIDEGHAAMYQIVYGVDQ